MTCQDFAKQIFQNRVTKKQHHNIYNLFKLILGRQIYIAILQHYG